MYNLEKTGKQLKTAKAERELSQETFTNRSASNEYDVDIFRKRPVQTGCAVKGTASMPLSVIGAMKESAPKAGSVYWVDFGDNKDQSLIIGIRPAVCLSKDTYNKNSPIAWFCPLTKQLKHIDCEYHQLLSKEDCIGLRESSMALGEQIRPVDRSMVKGYIGKITSGELLNQLIQAARAVMMEQV